MLEDKLAVIVLTHNRRAEVLRTLERLSAMPEQAEICAVDNASGDGTAAAIERQFPAVRLIRLSANFGAAGRNHGVRRVKAPYIAFCDDDTWWAPGSLERAVALLEEHTGLAAVTARVLVGEDEREDPASRHMACSPLPDALRVPGMTPVAGLLAGACVMRREAFLLAGGYEPRLFLGGEERLLAVDLLAAGWQLAYSPELVVHHYPSEKRDAAGRRLLLLRNALWCAWLRRPPAGAWAESRRWLAQAWREPALIPGLLSALVGLPWVLKNRRVVPEWVEAQLRLLDHRPA